MAPHHRDQKTEAAGLLMALSRASGSGVGIAGASVQNPPGLRHNIPKAPSGTAPLGPPPAGFPSSSSSKLEAHRTNLPPPPLQSQFGGMGPLDPLSPLMDTTTGGYPLLLPGAGGFGYDNYHHHHHAKHYNSNRDSIMTVSSMVSNASTASTSSVDSNYSVHSLNLQDEGPSSACPSPRPSSSTPTTALSFESRWAVPHNELMDVYDDDDDDDIRPSKKLSPSSLAYPNTTSASSSSSHNNNTSITSIGAITSSSSGHSLSILSEANAAAETEPRESVLTVPLPPMHMISTPSLTPTATTITSNAGSRSGNSNGGGGPARPRRSCPVPPAPYVIADAKVFQRARARSQPNICTYPGCGKTFTNIADFSKHTAEHASELRRFMTDNVDNITS